MAKQGLKIRGLRQRWMISSIGPIILILIMVAVLAAVSVVSNYYNSARSTLMAKAKAGADYFNTYSTDSYSAYYRTATLYTATFEDSDKIELQFLNSSGRIVVSSRGLTAGSAPETPEIAHALDSGETAIFSGRDPATNEPIIAVTSPLNYNGSAVGAMRYVTATHQLDRQMLIIVLVIAVALICVILLIVVSNMIFISNVVEPVAEVTEAAKRISDGSYGVQIPNKYSDEMGELVDNINDMSMKISQSEKMQTEFVSSVSHELRTPLTAIGGWSETLLSGGATVDSADARRGLSIILRETKRLTGMVEELLEFTRMQDGRFTLNIAPGNIRSDFEDTVFMYGNRLKNENITLEYLDNDDDIPEISCDIPRMRQVYLNLLDNAAKHGGEGGKITAEIRREDSEVVIRIRDFGPGIPEDELPLVKKKFYKGTSKARGSGIGLAVCEEIVSMHNGTLTLSNAEGGGILVTIRLPIGEQ